MTQRRHTADVMEVRRHSPEAGDSLLSLELAGRAWLWQKQQRGEQKGRPGHLPGRPGHLPGRPVAENAPCNTGDVGATLVRALDSTCCKEDPRQPINRV